VALPLGIFMVVNRIAGGIAAITDVGALGSSPVPPARLVASHDDR
jgi:hypothetical protein